MNHSDKFKSLLDKYGASLEQLGLNEVALESVCALEAVEILREERMAILGGDVFFFEQGDKVELAYANWYVNRSVDETFFTYVERSCLATLDYIKGFRGKKNAVAFFTLVVPSNDGSFHGETTER